MVVYIMKYYYHKIIVDIPFEEIEWAVKQGGEVQHLAGSLARLAPRQNAHTSRFFDDVDYFA